MIYRLNADRPYLFPDPAEAESSGLLAIGGDLSPQRLIAAYASGIFPWYDENSPLLWWSPTPRCTLLPHTFHLPQSLKRQLHREQGSQALFRLTLDTAFTQVIAHCANVPRAGQSGTWIVPDMITAYTRLHALGVAHSVEVWEKDKLMGGLYGVALGKAFFGESMFHFRPYASKIALVSLAQTLWNHHFTLIDCQMPTPHVLALGAQLLSRPDFLQQVRVATATPHPFPTTLQA